MKKIYKTIIVIEFILLLLFCLGYIVYESKVISNSPKFSQDNCEIIPEIIIDENWTSNSIISLITTNSNKKEDLNS